MKENNAITSQCPQYGRSMIEMLGVLAIIGVLSVGGIMGYSKAMFRYKINKTIEQITYIAGNVRTTFAAQGNYDGLNDSELWKKAHIFPDDMWKDDRPQNTWENEIFMYETMKNSTDGNANKAFEIEYDDIPEEACIELITHDWRNAQVMMMRVFTHTSYYFITPAKLDDAIKICNNYGEDVGAIFFHFDVDTSDSYWKDQIDATTATLAGS